MRISNNISKFSLVIIISMAGLLSACATKKFDQLPTLNMSNISVLSCDELKLELNNLYAHEDSVNTEASTGQAKQILWGGIWSVMADEKLEDQSRRDIRQRERALNEQRIQKGCK